MAESDEKRELTTFAARLAHVLERDGVKQKELARRLAGTGAPVEQVEAQRNKVLRWLAGKHQPEKDAARRVETELGLEEGYLVSVVRRKPRGRPAAVSRDREIADLREELGALREEVTGLAEDVAELRSVLAPHGGERPRGSEGSGLRRG